MSERKATIKRSTGETSIDVFVNLDSIGPVEINTGVGFFDHMLDLFAFHAGIELSVHCQGDLEVDGHHTVEDVAIALGKAIDQALGDKAAIARYAHAYVPLNEALGRVVIDLCGRGHIEFCAEFSRETVGDFDTELTEEFFRSFADSARATIHADLLRHRNVHHGAEVLFKALGKSLGIAIRNHPWRTDVVSTKGSLT